MACVVVLGKFGLVWSGAIFTGPETGQSSPRPKFWDWDWCQDTDFSEKYELGLEEKSLGMFPRIG